MNNDITKIKRGGARLGAGRKRLPPEMRRVTLTVRIPADAYAHLLDISSQTGMNKTALIVAAIRSLGIRKPRRPRQPRSPFANFADAPIIDVLADVARVM